ncbi:MAG: hypothetical protein HC828_15390 [Blastochloris sp.]|nr:hypothetical protein [Blastochloris sp.]
MSARAPAIASQPQSSLPRKAVLQGLAMVGLLTCVCLVSGIFLFFSTPRVNDTIDYIAADPNAEPLRGWDRLDELWLSLMTSTGARPGWSRGFVSWEDAARAAEILPGIDPLPDILPLCGFLGLYIALIGPLNYLILNRLNRREWAWLTIPLLIVIFSGVAWAIGFNLRGNEAIVNRVAFVRAWDDAERAQIDAVLGLLCVRAAPSMTWRPRQTARFARSRVR